jgi:uncharacterized DUF497 family protein
MHFTWDETKNKQNIRKHGIDFKDVGDMFRHPILIQIDQREDYGEDRLFAIGWIRTLMGVVVYVEKERDDIRIISARKATKKEVRYYEQRFKN